MIFVITDLGDRHDFWRKDFAKSKVGGTFLLEVLGRRIRDMKLSIKNLGDSPKYFCAI